MDSLELIEKYVEAGYGLGLSVRLPDKKLSPGIRMIELPDFPSVKLGALHGGKTNLETKIIEAFLQEVRKHIARFRPA